MAAAKKKVEEPVVEELVDEVVAGLPGTPVDFGLYDAPVGIPVPDLGPPADESEPVEGVARDDPREPLPPTPPGDFRLNNEA